MADSDSENEGILTNIQRLVIRPPGHTGKAKKGHICFDGSYETMNLGRVDFITNQEYDIFIRPDTANPRNRFWFHFTVENTQREQRVLFNVVNLSKARSLFREGLTPVVRSTSRPQWQRMPSNHVFYYKSPIHTYHCVLTFGFSFDLEDERYSFALAQPYSLSRYNMYVENILKSSFPFFKVETVAKSIQGRKVEMITITDPRNLERVEDHLNGGHKNEEGKLGNDGIRLAHNEDHQGDNRPEDQYGSASEDGSKSPTEASGSQIPVVFLMGRAHASETPSSFILQGLIDFLVSQHEIAQELRANVIFKIVPILNPDGVFMGNTRANLLGQDLNRHWHDSGPFAHPSVQAIKAIIQHLDQDPDFKLDIILDLHSHSSLLGLFIYGNSYDDVYRFERHIVFPKILSQNCPDFTFWDFYKILGYIPIDMDEDEMMSTSASKAGGASTASGGGQVRSFNLLRLREIANQRNQTARSFADNDLNEATSEDEAGGDVGRHQRGSKDARRRRCLDRRQSSSSLQSGGLDSRPIEATLRLESGRMDSHGEDGDISDNNSDSHDEAGGLAPKISPAPRVKFADDDLAIVPTASMARPESPFVSPCRKGKSASDNGQLIPISSPELEISISVRDPSRTSLRGGHRLGGRQFSNVNEIRVSGLGADSTNGNTGWAVKYEAQANVRKIGGGALISSKMPHTTRPRPLNPSLPVRVMEEASQKLSIIDFNELTQKDPRKKTRRSPKLGRSIQSQARSSRNATTHVEGCGYGGQNDVVRHSGADGGKVGRQFERFEFLIR
eukprot:maker-scaffold17_size721972-snap-gene-2.11 protein:Tk09965 transcript:maker-scaffold17_size721972-snap-gene-2.11-mRNA-1 annotation:"cytosolic carboxypeptidase 6"